MKFENRQTQFPGRKKVKKLNANNEEMEEYFVLIENAEGNVTFPGTPVSTANLNKGNWRDDTNLSFKTLEDGEEEPTPQSGITQIYTKPNGETWIVPSAESGAQAKVITDPAGTVIMVDNKRPPTVEFKRDPQGQISENSDAIASLTTNFGNHANNLNNPHGVTKEQIGLGNADNTSDADKPLSTAQQSALNSKAALTNGKISDPVAVHTVQWFHNALGLLTDNTTMSFRIMNGNAVRPFSELPDSTPVSVRLTRISTEEVHVECTARKGYDVLHAYSVCNSNGTTFGNWRRPKAWVEVWSGALIPGDSKTSAELGLVAPANYRLYYSPVANNSTQNMIEAFIDTTSDYTFNLGFCYVENRFQQDAGNQWVHRTFCMNFDGAKWTVRAQDPNGNVTLGSVYKIEKEIYI